MRSWRVQAVALAAEDVGVETPVDWQTSGLAAGWLVNAEMWGGGNIAPKVYKHESKTDKI